MRKRDGLRRRKMIQINKRRTRSVSIFRAVFFRHDHDVFPASPGAVYGQWAGLGHLQIFIGKGLHNVSFVILKVNVKTFLCVFVVTNL